MNDISSDESTVDPPPPPPAALAPLVPQMSGQASICSNAHMQLFSCFRPGSKKNIIHYILWEKFYLASCLFSSSIKVIQFSKLSIKSKIGDCFLLNIETENFPPRLKIFEMSGSITFDKLIMRFSLVMVLKVLSLPHWVL